MVGIHIMAPQPGEDEERSLQLREDGRIRWKESGMGAWNQNRASDEQFSLADIRTARRLRVLQFT